MHDQKVDYYKRQKISFEIKDNKIILDQKIINHNIRDVLKIFAKVKSAKVTIVNTSLNNFGIDITMDDNKIIFWELFNISTYFKYNGIIIKNNKLTELYGHHLVKRHHDSFFQTEYGVANKIHDTIYQNNNNSSVKIFLGGEMYYYGLLLQNYYDIGYFFSDFDSIIDDALDNLKYLSDIRSIHIEKINYNDHKFNINNNNIDIIVNNGKTGLGHHMVQEICKLKVNKITIISCCTKSFNRDYDELRKYYKLDKTIEIIQLNKFSVTVYVLIIL